MQNPGIGEGSPYIVPLCFGYDAGTLYFHSAPAGKKIDLLKNNRNRKTAVIKVEIREISGKRSGY